MRRSGAELSIASATWGSFEKVAVRAPRNPTLGRTAQTIRRGSNPRTRKTPIKRPHTRNHLFAHGFMVVKTPALMMALSMLEIISKRERPITERSRVNKFIITYYHNLI